MRILVASDHYPPFIGGAHRQTQLLSKELLRRGHDVAVATVWSGGLPAHQDDDGVQVHRLRQLRTALPALVKDTNQQHQPPFPDPLTVFGLRRLINQFKPDVVHVYGWFSYSCAAALLGKNIPLLLSARDYAYGCPTRTLVFRGEHICDGPQLTKCLNCAAQYFGAPKGVVSVASVLLGRSLLRRKVRGVHSISSYVQDMVVRDFLAADPLAAKLPRHVIPSFRENEGAQASADPATVAPYLAKLPDTPFMMFVGAFRRVKGVKELFEAYRRLDNPPPLVLVGTMERDTPQQVPPGVIMLEKLPHAAVMAAWERSLFGVIPSLWPEPLGSVVYEAMSKGKAVIGTTPGGHTDMIIDGQTGLLIPPGDVEALEAAMRRLLDQPVLRERLGQAARQHALRFTADYSVPQFESFYRELLAGQHRNGPQSAPLLAEERELEGSLNR